MKLTADVFATRCKGGSKRAKNGSNTSSDDRLPVHECTEADCSNMDITHIEDISFAINLHKLNLSSNNIKHPDALSGIRHNKDLTWLNLSNNKLFNLDGVGTLRKLLVLNLSHNEITRMSHHIQNCTELKALILNNNRIARIENLSALRNLSTLVLSHNQLETLPLLTALPKLAKLSIAHNSLRAIPDLRPNTQLKELRLNDNKIINVPGRPDATAKVQTPASTAVNPAIGDPLLPPSIEILDLGNNLIRGLEDMYGLQACPNLVNLNLKGNPICAKLMNVEGKAIDSDSAAKEDKPSKSVGKKGHEKSEEGSKDSISTTEAGKNSYRESILGFLTTSLLGGPTLRILDNERFDPRFLERQKKRKAMAVKRQRKEQKSKEMLESGKTLKRKGRKGTRDDDDDDDDDSGSEDGSSSEHAGSDAEEAPDATVRGSVKKHQVKGRRLKQQQASTTKTGKRKRTADVDDVDMPKKAKMAQPRRSLLLINPEKEEEVAQMSKIVDEVMGESDDDGEGMFLKAKGRGSKSVDKVKPALSNAGKSKGNSISKTNAPGGKATQKSQNSKAQPQKSDGKSNTITNRATQKKQVSKQLAPPSKSSEKQTEQPKPKAPAPAVPIPKPRPALSPEEDDEDEDPASAAQRSGVVAIITADSKSKSSVSSTKSQSAFAKIQQQQQKQQQKVSKHRPTGSGVTAAAGFDMMDIDAAKGSDARSGGGVAVNSKTKTGRGASIWDDLGAGDRDDGIGLGGASSWD
ncbi:hypothetical protein HK102_003044 [Quaeritorhiza haematococci]|nr:hypothetical protein HK102_003044 [Quaeritorhiza haematococci]